MNEKQKLLLKSIEEMKSNGALDSDSYCKCIVELSLSFLREGDTDACIETISKCPPDYFKTKQLQHMQEDEAYKDNVVYLAYKFMQLGIVDVGYEFKTNQNKGLA